MRSMVKIAKLLVLFLYFFSWEIYCQELAEVKNFGANPGNLKMYHYIPSDLPRDKPVALVVVLHGCSQNAKEIAHDSGWNELADQYHFIVLYPQQRRMNNSSNCFNWFLNKDIEGEKGELFSIRSMIAFELEHQNVDSKMIFSYGVSAGAMMSVSLLANYPELFNAGASFAGGAYKSAENAFQGMKTMANPPNKTGEEWAKSFSFYRDSIQLPRLMVVHGDKDKVVAIENSIELIEQWMYMLNVDVNRNKTMPLKKYPNVRESNFFRENEEVIRFYRIKDIGHKLAINPGKGIENGGKSGMFAKDVGFFSTYFTGKFFGVF